MLCKKFHVAKPWDNYCLQDAATKHYISSEEFDFPAYYKFSQEPMLSLKLNPIHVASTLLNDLKTAKDIAAKKMLLFQLRLKLIVSSLVESLTMIIIELNKENEEDFEFCEEFLRQGGAQCLIPQLDVSLPPSFTSLHLTCCSAMMGNHCFDWSIIDSEIIDRISNCIASPNTNVQQSALVFQLFLISPSSENLIIRIARHDARNSTQQ